MGTRSSRKYAAAISMLALFCLVGSARADDATKGRQIYLHYCASCHGIAGEGNGPLAQILTTPPANLRLLYQRYGNPLPEDQIAKFIDGRTAVKAHGPRDMPVWGEHFYAETGNEQQVKKMIDQLVAYLQSIQNGPHTAMR
jgi:mono/diheme cytochrome c family protein